MQDFSDDKHEKKDAETTQTCKLKRRSNSVLSDPQRNHLLSRERKHDAARLSPITAGSESDDLTESVSMGHCVYVLRHHKPKNSFRLKENIVILKQISYRQRTGTFFCFQSVNADPSHWSQQPGLLREALRQWTISKTETMVCPESPLRHENPKKSCFTASTKNLHCLDSTSLFLSHHNPGQHSA